MNNENLLLKDGKIDKTLKGSGTHYNHASMNSTGTMALIVVKLAKPTSHTIEETKD